MPIPTEEKVTSISFKKVLTSELTKNQIMIGENVMPMNYLEGMRDRYGNSFDEGIILLGDMAKSDILDKPHSLPARIEDKNVRVTYLGNAYKDGEHRKVYVSGNPE